MSLTRREILEQLIRLGIKPVSSLKMKCRDFEKYWESRTNTDGVSLKEINVMDVKQ